MSAPPVRVLVLPRDSSPYLRLLYAELERQGVCVRYLGNAVHSRLVSLALLPGEMLLRRLQGYRLLHVHWVFRFTVRGADRVPLIRLAMQAWFAVFLFAARVAGLRIVWTAHNVLPHGRVFWNDVSARRSLVRASDLVVVHHTSTLDALTQLGARPRASVVIPHGPFTALLTDESPNPSAVASGDPAWADTATRRFLFFGNVEAYKGVEDLLAAFAQLPGHLRVGLVVAGACRDEALALRIAALATGQQGLVLRLERVPDDEVGRLLRTADVMVLPYREVTTSGAALLGLAAGLPVIAPSLPGLADLPAEAVRRYDGTVAGLRDAMLAMSLLPPEGLTTMAAAARAAAGDPSWTPVAAATLAAYRSVLSSSSPAPG